MISPEVWQDLHQRYFYSLWPWLILFVLANFLFFIQKYRRLFYGYVILSWIVLGFVYIRQFFSAVHTAAGLIMMLFLLQAMLILLIELVFKHSLNQVASFKQLVAIRKLGVLIYCLCAFLPISFLLENTKGTLLLFGWGAEQTALGTIGLILYRYHHKALWILLVIPSLWLIFSAFLL